MSLRKTFQSGRLLTTILGFNRGRTKYSSSEAEGQAHKIILQEWNAEDKTWDDTEDEVTAYEILAITEPYDASTPVVLIYFFKTYFVLLMEC